MDEEGMLIDLAEARGTATAVVCIQSAIVAMLVQENRLTVAQAVEVSGLADTLLTSLTSLPPDVREMARRALSGFASGYTKLLPRH
jgi:hypothetical protein